MHLKHYGEGDMSWWVPSGGGKSQYYVWFLGARPAAGVRSPEAVLNVMRRLLLLHPHNAAPPPKLTLQISDKGVKINQSLAPPLTAPPNPASKRGGKPKPPSNIKSLLPPHAVAFSIIGPAPFNDVVGVTLLVMGGENSAPVHVHCYRCDSPETAAHMNAAFQRLVSRPDTQRRVADVEVRLGIASPTPPPRPHRRTSDPPAPKVPPHADSALSLSPASTQSDQYTQDVDSDDDDYDEVALFHEKDGVTTRVANLHRVLYRELKEKLRFAPKPPDQIFIPPKDYGISPVSDGAMTSSTSGFGSDLSATSKFRFSMSQLPQSADDFDMTPAEYPPYARGQSAERPSMRLFGDTLKLRPEERHRPSERKVSGGERYRGRSRGLEGRRFHRSVDNLHHSAGLVRRPSQQRLSELLRPLPPTHPLWYNHRRSSVYLPPNAKLF